MNSSVSPGFALLLTSCLAMLFLRLALSEKQSDRSRFFYALIGMAFTLSLGLFFSSLGVERYANASSFPTPIMPPNINIERLAHTTVETDLVIHHAAHGLGGWLVVMAAGELLRVILKRAAGTELLGPAILFLTGALLIEPQWGIALALAVGLASVAAITFRGKMPPPPPVS
jgi:hypothetical protein